MVKDRYDGITVGTLATERWLERNAVLSRLLGKGYVLANRPDLEPPYADPIKRVQNNPDGADESNVYEVIASPYNPSGGMDVNIQDQTSPVVISKVSRLKFEGNVAQAGVKGETRIFAEIADIGNFAVGDFITVFSIPDNRFYQGKALVVNGGTGEITLDTQLDFSYPVGSFITSATTNLIVDGTLAAPVIFGVRNTQNRIPAKVDVVRLIFSAVTDNPVDLSKFLDIIGGITNGLAVRRMDGDITNYFNVKTNKELAAILYDFTVLAATNPVQGQDGLLARLTFGGQSKVGVVVRLAEDDDLEVLVQDLLLTLSPLTVFEITVEGHLVE